MLKTLGRVLKNVLIWLFPVCIIIGLFANIRELENFDFFTWIQQLPDVMSNPIKPLQVAVEYITKSFADLEIKRFTDIFVFFAKLYRMFVFAIYGVGQCIIAIFNDIINFIKWLTLGYF